MAALEEAFKRAYELHNSENPLSRMISKGFVFEMEDEVAVNFVKDNNNNPPYFLTNKFKEKTKGKKVNKHFWILLKNYQKRGNSGNVEIVNRSSLKEEGLNRKPNDYVQRRPHVEIDSNHDYCKLDKPGLYKGTLPLSQKLPKKFLKELDSSSEEFVCYDPESEKIIKHFKSIGKVYD